MGGPVGGMTVSEGHVISQSHSSQNRGASGTERPSQATLVMNTRSRMHRRQNQIPSAGIVGT